MGAINDFMNRHGIGNYTDANGNPVTHDSLPPDVKDRVESLGALRDLAKEAGNTAEQKNMQSKINRLYDPSTRDDDMLTHNIQMKLEDRLNNRK